MAKNLDPNKLLAGIKKDFKKETSFAKDADSIIRMIHEKPADEKEKNILPQEEHTRTTIDIPKALHKKIRMRVADMDLTLKDYLLGLVKKDLELQ